jgi:hypothetical protein
MLQKQQPASKVAPREKAVNKKKHVRNGMYLVGKRTIRTP